VAALLRPPAAPFVVPSLTSATIRNVVSLPAHRLATTPLELFAPSAIGRLLGFLPTARAGAAFAGVVTALGAALVLGLAVHRAGGDASRGDAILAARPPIDAPVLPRVGNRSPQPSPDRRSPGPPSSSRPLAENESAASVSARPARFPRARARPITGITVDGSLEDWPANLEKFAIKQQLRGREGYNSQPVAPADSTDASFMAGYDPLSELIYLAVVVRDDDVVVDPSNTLNTDAVEIFMDGAPPESSIADHSAEAAPSRESNKVARATDPFGLASSGNWRESLDASKMPVLQYAGIPGGVAAYGDPWRANPSLVYARTPQTAAKMKFHRAGSTITYEWSIRPFDRFPDRPSRLYPGRRLGLEVAVVDKDSNNRRGGSPPTYLTWGSPPIRFKGVDADSLGELVLAGPE
jgi:hypothetical protein